MTSGIPPSPPSRPRGVRLIALAAVPFVLLTGLLGWSTLHGSDGAVSPRGPAGSASPRSAEASPGDSPTRPEASRPLAGRTVVIDPGHNPHNAEHTDAIARRVGIGTGRKECDTTGTATGSGYSEAEFALDVSRRVRKLLEARGAVVKLTQDGDRRYGPCVDERARIGNRAHADAVVSVHADGAPAGERGFHVILPGTVRAGAADTSSVVRPSRVLGERIAGAFARVTDSRPAAYAGSGRGLDVREDLGGLNLSKVPKVFVECGNMRNARDADRFTSAAWRGRAAQGISDGVTAFLSGPGSRSGGTGR
ncbi:N-acetylmuramoyl-L-alanine amidase [Streptomyces meridianus]|uniref:N-acetylmuramoyl-L-alanine amidase n=1 Tax=Streptomyces meridianus TaxID=2938945 RepID=A0ABT0XAD1_9ACTN|nr:N-acetylmuramoyl-L-alanine amidase [Streptomyces meridianus]MCM2579320.1 N-acetylmuramoyl-L-alanine amidase [Streptomyces meridianus]